MESATGSESAAFETILMSGEKAAGVVEPLWI